MGMIWPNGAKTAFALCFDLDGDTIWRNKTKGLPNGESYLKGPSVGLYGPKRGAWRILGLLKEAGLKATWFIPAKMVEEHPDLARTVLEEGHELGHHGYDHTSDYGATCQEQLAYIQRCQDIFLKYTGVTPVGFRPTGFLLPETEQWLYTQGGGLYSSAGMGDEVCEFLTVGGVKTSAVNIPCRDELDDYIQTVFSSYPQVLPGLPRIAPYREVLSNFIRELEGAVRYSNSLSTAFHPQISGSPGRALMLESLMRYVLEHRDTIWCAPCRDIAKAYRAAKEADGCEG